MIDIDLIRNYFPIEVGKNDAFRKYMVKEYIQLMVLNFMYNLQYSKQLVFIGGTNLRLVKGIDRFSEDLDFDCKNFTQEDFTKMTDEVLSFLHRSGMRAETRDKANDKLTAFRRNFFFPELLFELGLSGYKEERFLIKVESQDQQYDYTPISANIKRAGFFFPVTVPPDPILCAMKLSALLSRQKGRDFYDAMFLLGQTEPDYGYLAAKRNIHSKDELKHELKEVIAKTDLIKKYRDFDHLLFNKDNKEKVLHFDEFVNML